MTEQVVDDLVHLRKVTDFRFDQVYPKPIRELSKNNWTPVQVAIRAAQMLTENDRHQILDFGSGCGKFTIIGALTTSAHFTGIEEKPELVAASKSAAKQLGATRVKFVCANGLDLDWKNFDAVYFYNPFHALNKSVIPSKQVYEKLKTLRTGSRVLSFHGVGCDLPSDYRLITKELCGTGVLELYEKT